MIAIRNAAARDVPAIVAMLADDPLGREREDIEVPAPYLAAFAAIDADSNNELLVALDGERIVGTLQITYAPGLSRKGAWRATLEGVRVSTEQRGHGVGRTLVLEAIDRARARGCRIVQLTSDLSRVEARRFYESLGFRHTHAGLKMAIDVES
jgi:ribosomal protein S18 acetylase RimI-like enzyme